MHESEPSIQVPIKTCDRNQSASAGNRSPSSTFLDISTICHSWCLCPRLLLEPMQMKQLRYGTTSCKSASTPRTDDTQKLRRHCRRGGSISPSATIFTLIHALHWKNSASSHLPSFWLGLKAEQRDVYVHKLIRDYLAANQNNRPKATHLDQNAKADLDTRESTFTIPADQFSRNGSQDTALRRDRFHL